MWFCKRTILKCSGSIQRNLYFFFMVGTFFWHDFLFSRNRHSFLLYRNKFLGHLRHFEDISGILKRVFKNILNVKNKESVVNGVLKLLERNKDIFVPSYTTTRTHNRLLSTNNATNDIRDDGNTLSCWYFWLLNSWDFLHWDNFLCHLRYFKDISSI